MAKGSCWCRKIQYTIDTPPSESAPLPAMLCHCLTCQRITGSAFTTCISVPKPSLTLTSGSEHVKTYTGTHHEVEGMGITVHFCGNCGTTLWKAVDSDGMRDVFIVFAGALDGEGLEVLKGKAAGVDGVESKGEIWVKERAGWIRPIEGAMQCEAFPTS
ncbi:unnamed protein product [Calypogeia fissa]